jgi:hypothetical protein
MTLESIGGVGERGFESEKWTRGLDDPGRFFIAEERVFTDPGVAIDYFMDGVGVTTRP